MKSKKISHFIQKVNLKCHHHYFLQIPSFVVDVLFVCLHNFFQIFWVHYFLNLDLDLNRLQDPIQDIYFSVLVHYYYQIYEIREWNIFSTLLFQQMVPWDVVVPYYYCAKYQQVFHVWNFSKIQVSFHIPPVCSLFHHNFQPCWFLELLLKFLNIILVDIYIYMFSQIIYLKSKMSSRNGFRAIQARLFLFLHICQFFKLKHAKFCQRQRETFKKSSYMP